MESGDEFWIFPGILVATGLTVAFVASFGPGALGIAIGALVLFGSIGLVVLMSATGNEGEGGEEA